MNRLDSLLDLRQFHLDIRDPHRSRGPTLENIIGILIESRYFSFFESSTLHRRGLKR